jgi:hypothetical protein
MLAQYFQNEFILFYSYYHGQSSLLTQANQKPLK